MDDTSITGNGSEEASAWLKSWSDKYGFSLTQEYQDYAKTASYMENKNLVNMNDENYGARGNCSRSNDDSSVSSKARILKIDTKSKSISSKVDQNGLQYSHQRKKNDFDHDITMKDEKTGTKMIAMPLNSNGINDSHRDHGEQAVGPGKHGSESGYMVSASKLRQQVSEKELELLELRSRTMQETSILRSTLRKREMDLVEREAHVRQLRLKLAEEEGQLKTAKANHENIVGSLMKQVQDAVKEVKRFREKVRRAEHRREQSTEFHKKEIKAKNEEIMKLERENELVRAKLCKELEKAKGSTESEIVWRQKVTTLQSELSHLKNSYRVAQNQLDEAKISEMNLEKTLQKVRNERDKAESLATDLNNANDDLRLQLERSEQQNGNIGNQQPLLLKDAAALEYNKSLKEQMMRMKTELQACVVQLKEWKVRVERAENRNQELEKQIQQMPIDNIKEKDQDDESGANIGLGEAKIKEIEDARNRAEWERVEVEKEHAQLAISLSESEKKASMLKVELEEAQKAVKYSNEEVLVYKHQCESLQEQVDKLQKKLEHVQEQATNDIKSNEEGINKKIVDIKKSTCKLALETNLTNSAIKTLLQLLHTYLDGEQPGIELLLDEVIPADQLETLHDNFDIVHINETAAKTEDIRKQITDTRARIADSYAEQVGSECNMQ